MKKVSREASSSAAPAGKSLLKGLGKKEARPVPTRREWRALNPLRKTARGWREEEGVIVIEIHRAQNWKTRLLNLVFPLPESHRVALDAIGSTVWRASDGESSVEQIAKKISRELQIERREAEASLQQFFKELGRRGYIGFKIDAPSDHA